MRTWLGAGMLMGPGDATGAVADYPATTTVQAGVVFDSGAQEGTYVGESTNITVDVTAPSIDVEVS